MTRVLRVQLLRFGLPGALLILLVGTVALFLDRGLWSGGWMELAMEQRDHLMLLCPLALAIGGWLARREHRATVTELFAGTPRPQHQRVLLTLTAVGLPIALAYPAILAVSAPWIMATAEYLPSAAYGVVAVGVLAVIASAWTGLAVGRLVPSPATAPGLAVAGFVAVLAGPMAFREEWQSVLASPAWAMSPWNEFQTVPAAVSAAQAILALTVIVAAAVVLSARRWQTRSVAAAPIALGLVAAIAVMPHDYDRVTIDPVAQELVCTDDAPRVCVGRAHSGLLTEITPKAREALALLAKLPGAPTSAQEDTDNYLDESDIKPPPDGVVEFRMEVGPDGRLADAGHLVTRMLEGGGTSFANCTEFYEIPVARAAGSWLSGRAPVNDPEEAGVTFDDGTPYTVLPETTALWEKLRALPEAEALAKVAAVRKAGLECTDMTGLLG
ncbi:hypothetical protein [Actinoplanes couchii]|uniref:ABC transporter permease n=1 Tax=Actinoplanes couchii TaxID=403638 RepID=A0ABQ3XG84_9ACTN|nr:hypothetical protein [Actinoplanes couchii]MDR6321006.1 hypothetical protein [Actinoplanes couchii]GID57517.1 hypothetical protein Aco03nite_059210 [Actinoplanes couchii]